MLKKSYLCKVFRDKTLVEKESALFLVKSPNLNNEYTRHGAAHIRGLPIRVCIFRCLAIPTREYGGQPTFFNNKHCKISKLAV